MFKDLDPILHNQLRLSIMSLLISVSSAGFKGILKETGASTGNLSVQLTKLKDAGYIDIEKSFRGNYPLTTCRITKKGIEAFENYVEAIRSYLEK